MKHRRRRVAILGSAVLAAVLAAGLLVGPVNGLAAQFKAARPRITTLDQLGAMAQRRTTNAERRAAAAKLQDLRTSFKANPLIRGLGALLPQLRGAAATLTPGAIPDYYNVPNYANSPLPDLDASGNPVPGTGIRKFIDSLPGLGAANANNIGQYLPVANPDTVTYPGSDYYVIGLREYHEKLGSDIPATALRGYYQINNGTVGPTDHTNNYLGPTIIARRNRPVRVKFINQLPTGTGGNLFLPVDTTVMGSGMGPKGGMYTQNRATLHLHGGLTPWISDGTPHQWTTPASESTTYTEGVSVFNVPDMDAGHEPTGTLTFYYTNQQSARLMFYHDHAYGITRLNVYAGEAAPYVLSDPIEQTLVNGGSFKNSAGTTVTVAASTIPTEQIPLVVQDKTFVPKDSQLASEDPTWDKAKWGGLGNLWLPHVYMPNQINGNDIFGNELGGVSAMGRWDYSPWFYPPVLPVGGTGSFGTPVANPLWGQVGQPAQNPGTPLPTIVPEAFMDTPLVNGTAYPFLKVGRKAYRFRILNACNDRTLNLQLYLAKSNGQMWSNVTSTTLLDGDAGEVTMTVAAPHPGDPNWPSTWPTDGRDGGVPDPASVGPSFIQIGNEGGILPSATVLPNTPVGYEYFRRTITVLNVTNKTLFLGPAERADVVVDFSQVPDGTKLIMYNDAPAPVPAFDSRLDYYTGGPDQTSSGGAPTTKAGYGPNTRTVMQFQVQSSIASQTAYNVPNLETALQAAYGVTQDRPIVPEKAYGAPFGTTFSNNYAHTVDETMTFKPMSQPTSVTIGFQDKAIIEGFDQDFGRMNANLGGTLPNFGPAAGAATPFDYVDPPTDVTTNTVPGTLIGTMADGTQIWRVDHQGVDTHAIHFHLFNVEVLNRIALDGQLFTPDANELGWKETVRMNPGQDVVIALRPIAPTLPWKLPDSIRPLNPALPVGATFVDQLGTTVVNAMTDFGWEYVWHCHLLGHEENDMMRPLVFLAAPAAPSGLSVTANPLQANFQPSAHLTWVNSAAPSPVRTNSLIMRATNSAFTSGVTTFSVAAGATSFNDNTIPSNKSVYYRVRAESAVAYSGWSNTFVGNTATPNPVTGLHPTSATSTTLTYAWVNPSTGAYRTGIRVQYSTVGSAGPWTTFNGVFPRTTQTVTITGLHAHTKYWVRILTLGYWGAGYSAGVYGATAP